MKINEIKACIGEYFLWLQKALEYKGNHLQFEDFDRIKNLVFVYMINLNYGGTYGKALFVKHIKILKSCKVLKWLVEQIEKIVNRMEYHSSKQLVELLKNYAEDTYEVNFVNRSNWRLIEKTYK